jgi:Tol biopolymer transport system component
MIPGSRTAWIAIVLALPASMVFTSADGGTPATGAAGAGAVLSREALPVSGELESRIVFARAEDGHEGWSIFSIRPDGSDIRLEVPYSSGMGEYNPAVSPDGAIIVFNSYRWGGWKLASTVHGTGSVARVTRGDDYYTNASFRADGSAITFEHATRSGTSIVWSRPDGLGMEPLAVGGSTSAGEMLVPVWTGDGAVVFSSDATGRNKIYRTDGDGGVPTTLTVGDGDDFAPAVSPVDGRVVFYSDRDGSADLFLMKPDGSSVRNLTHDLRSETSAYSFSGRTYWRFKAAWSPDGRRVVFVSNVDGNFELYTVGPDGGPPVRVTYSHEEEITPTWGMLPEGQAMREE